jgi:hypothetical protein
MSFQRMLVAAIAGDDLHLAVNQAEITIRRPTIVLDAERVRELTRKFEARQNFDRSKSGPRVHPNWFRKRESSEP